MGLRELISSGSLSVAESVAYGERLRRAFEDVWRRHQERAGAAWNARRLRLYAKINGQTQPAAENTAREAIGSLVHESGCSPSTAREIYDALGTDWRFARNTANLTLAVSD